MTAGGSLRCVRTAAAWNAEAGTLASRNLYYRWEYFAAWAREDDAEALGILFEHPAGRVCYPLLRLPLDALPGGAGRADVRTAYDFGGPFVEGPDPALALQAFDVLWREHCHDDGVVTEFARLHPLCLEALPSDAVAHAQNYVVDLRLADAALAGIQHPSHRRAVRKALRSGVEFDIGFELGAADLRDWGELYERTMRRVAAPEHYLFSSRLFAELLALSGVRMARVRADDEPLALAIVVESGDDLFYFLGASSERGRELRANNFLFASLIDDGRRAGRRFLHLGAGGGASLRAFKENLATGTVPYHLLRRVHDPRCYARLAAAAGATEPREFPAYRSRLAALRARNRSGA